MEKLQQQLVDRAVASLNVRFRTYTPEALKLVAREYYEDLDGEISNDVFILAVKGIRKKVRFFPSIMEILEEAALHRKNVHPMYQLAEDPLHYQQTKEEKAQDAERFKIIKQVAAGSLSWEAATEQLEKLGGSNNGKN